MTMLLNLPITTAIGVTSTTAEQFNDARPMSVALQAIFTYGSGGTTANAYVQTSLDSGVTWFDIANFSFTTSTAKFMYNLSGLTPVTTENATRTDGSMTANTSLDGFIGDLLRVKYSSTGTYGGNTTLRIDAVGTMRLTSLV